MDLNWLAGLVPVITLLYVMHLQKKISLLKEQIEAVEIDRAWFRQKRDEQLTEIEMTLYAIRDEVTDMNDYQHGRGSYAHDPDRP
jgi:predicted Holliday junction resolvase-like endonuclease